MHNAHSSARGARITRAGARARAPRHALLTVCSRVAVICVDYPRRTGL